ncbi:RluA family pseudouridine synthase, partial [bacterium]|nr:RluA family pseudouridine synthase [bacterium]
MKISNEHSALENRLELEIEEGYTAAERLDVVVTTRLPKISRSRVKKLIKEERITIGGLPVKPSQIVQGGETITIIFPHPPRPAAAPDDIPLDIVHEDEWLLVVNKPAGMVVHPAAGHHSGTLVNALLGRYENLPSPSKETTRPGIVHRLDKDTSGLLVVAKSEYIMTALGYLFHEHDIEREYLVLVWGNPEDAGTINAPLARHPEDRKRFAVVEDGKRAVSHWRVLKRFEFLSLIAVTLETGRTHQIRVHFSHRGYPVFGDSTYGGRMHGLSRLTSFQRQMGRKALELMPRQALHARILGFKHPGTGENVHFEAETPA